MCGNLSDLGDWNPEKGMRLFTSPDLYPEWRTKEPLRLIKNSTIEFKFAVLNSSRGDLVRWETLPGDTNRSYFMRWFKVKLNCIQGELLQGEIIEAKFRVESFMQEEDNSPKGS